MFSAKKILLLSFVIVLIVAIPVTIYLISLQQPKVSSVPATTLSFSPQNQTAKTGDSLNFDLNINPGTNSISWVKVLITYDSTKLSATDGSFVPNPSAFSSVVSGPTYEPGKITVTLSIGPNSPPLTKQTKVGTITFKALQPTDTASTQIAFGNDTQVLSTGATDQFNQNVLSNTVPANITIAGASTAISITPTPTTALIQSSTQSSLLTPTPTTAPLDSTPAANLTLTPTPTTTQIATSSGPICLSFTADRALNGTVPFNVNFTLVATDAAATTTKVTFDFGDGQVKNLTAADNITGYGANALVSHVYNTPGTFTATGSITDANGNVSAIGSCSLTVVVKGAGVSGGPSPLPPTGPTSVVTFGIIGAILLIIGGALLLAL